MDYFNEFKECLYEYYMDEFRPYFHDENELNQIVDSYIVMLYRSEIELTNEDVHIISN
jgi:hypothetical protein